MRIQYDYNLIPQVEEITSIDLITCEVDGETMAQVAVNAVPFADYELDDEFTIDDAIKNYKEVSEKLLVNGYCRTSDFTHIRWY